MTARERVARSWHEGSDHAADGVPFGGPVCNCWRVAGRMLPMLRKAYDEGWFSAVGSAPEGVWVDAQPGGGLRALSTRLGHPDRAHHLEGITMTVEYVPDLALIKEHWSGVREESPQ